jgi:hypothetical protein
MEERYNSLRIRYEEEQSLARKREQMVGINKDAMLEISEYLQNISTNLCLQNKNPPLTPRTTLDKENLCANVQEDCAQKETATQAKSKRKKRKYKRKN